MNVNLNDTKGEYKMNQVSFGTKHTLKMDKGLDGKPLNDGKTPFFNTFTYDDSEESITIRKFNAETGEEYAQAATSNDEGVVKMFKTLFLTSPNVTRQD
jgi:hypothetical protein